MDFGPVEARVAFSNRFGSTVMVESARDIRDTCHYQLLAEIETVNIARYFELAIESIQSGYLMTAPGFSAMPQLAFGLSKLISNVGSNPSNLTPSTNGVFDGFEGAWLASIPHNKFTSRSDG